VASVADIFFFHFRHDLVLYIYVLSNLPPIMLISLAMSLGYSETQKTSSLKNVLVKKWLLVTTISQGERNTAKAFWN
jgi:hypothetical protein